MTSAEFKAARQTLGLTQSTLAERMQLGGDGKRTIRRWEYGERPIPGPVAVLVRLWLTRPNPPGR